MAERYLADDYTPDAVAEATGIPAEQIRRIAAEIAHVAFEEEIVLDRPWTDAWGRKHDKMIGRPVSMHAMRGISAHSNGFPDLPHDPFAADPAGLHRLPRGFPLQTALPQADAAEPVAPRPARGHPARDAAGRPASGFSARAASPLDRGGRDALAPRQGVFMGRADVGPWADAHGVEQRGEKDPYGIDVLFLYMANMAWNSSMNVPGTLEALTAKDDDGEYVIPKIIYSDAYYSETVPYADLILPDTTYLERWDCISLLDRPISEPDMVADAIRQPVVEPDRDVRGFQDVLIDLGARLGLPGFVKEDGSPAYPGGYPDYMVNHERKPGIGPLSGWRGEDGTRPASARPTPNN
jgi:anaerobic selenocysteine-containing dehydrogenase